MSNISFHKRLQNILNKEKPKLFTRSCGNFWCKAPYEVKVDDYNMDPLTFGQCNKCRNDSSVGKVTNNGTKEYEGTRNDPDTWNKEVEGKIEFKNLGIQKNK